MVVLRMILHLLTSDETKFDIIQELSCIQELSLHNVNFADRITLVEMIKRTCQLRE